MFYVHLNALVLYNSSPGSGWVPRKGVLSQSEQACFISQIVILKGRTGEVSSNVNITPRGLCGRGSRWRRNDRQQVNILIRT